ncbi:MAG: acetolactate synthase large subunit [Colwellia sp.]
MNDKLNGAEAMLTSLVGAGVEVCFANPGTSEMQMVAALDRVDGMRPVLALFEGVASGAADGYGRMADKPAATVLHMGPGLSNAMANLHNAQRAQTPMVNLIGDHASAHLQFDAPLTADIKGQAKTVCHQVKTCKSASNLPHDAIEIVQAAKTNEGQVCSLIIPANTAWEDSASVEVTPIQFAKKKVPLLRIQAIADILKNDQCNAMLLGGKALREEGLKAAGRIFKATGTRILNETLPARRKRGAGVFPTETVPYLAEIAIQFLKPFDNIVLAGAKAPVGFFAYPNVPSQLHSEHTSLPLLCAIDEDITDALITLAKILNATEDADTQPRITPPAPRNELCPMGVGAILAECMPENTIVVDEANTASLAIHPMTQGAARHDILGLTGGSIGIGLPMALGAAIACPDRKVICLEGDGSGMYTPQALWSIARENLDVTVVILKNNSYAILDLELQRTGAKVAEGNASKARSLLSLENPTLDWIKLSEGMGVPATNASTVAQFRHQFSQAMNTRGPRLIQATLIKVDLAAAMAELMKLQTP